MMDPFGGSIEEFFGICPKQIQHPPSSKKRAVTVTFESFEEPNEGSDASGHPRTRSKDIDDVLKFDWSLKTELTISSPSTIPITVKSSDFSFENQCSLSLFPACSTFGNSWFSSKECYSSFPYYKYPANGPLVNIADPSIAAVDQSGGSWVNAFRCLFFQFESGQLDYFYLLNGNFTLLFVLCSGYYELRARINDRRIISSLVEQGTLPLW